MSDSLKGMIQFPCCTNNKALVHKGASGKASIPCTRCGKYILFDYDIMTASIISAAKGAVHKLQKGA